MKPPRVLLLNLSEFIGYVDLTDFREISPIENLPEMMTSEIVSRNSDIENSFPVGSIYATRLAYF